MKENPAHHLATFSRKNRFIKILFISFVFLLANRFFFVGPWWKQRGVFDTADIGNLLITCSFLFLIIFSEYRKAIKNPLSLLIISYLLLVFLHFCLAQINYHQSIFDSLVAIRHQNYFLVFFIFCMLLKDMATITFLLDTLIFWAMVIFLLSVVNYFGFTIFYHKWALGHGMRSGVLRAFVPSMNLVSFATLWAFNKWSLARGGIVNNSSLLLLILAHLFRQTRMRLIGLVASFIGILLYKRKFKAIIICLILTCISIITLDLTTKKNIITDNFISAFENYANRTGTWTPRLKEMQQDIKEFKKSPWLGNGLSAVRQYGTHWRQLKTKDKSAKADLGYTSWLKFYGIAGAVWFILFFGYQLFLIGRVTKFGSQAAKNIVTFNLSYLMYILFTFVTLNSLMSPHDILLICLNAAIIVRVSAIANEEKASQPIKENVRMP